MIFQIRDDIFDYYDSTEIGKPTGNDMAEGKLTLPVIYALNHSDYESMKGMLFGDIPSFEAVMDAVRQLENEINA